MHFLFVAQVQLYACIHNKIQVVLEETDIVTRPLLRLTWLLIVVARVESPHQRANVELHGTDKESPRKAKRLTTPDSEELV